jgi:cytochrome bd-type quinol oxidase subunit 2
MEALYVSVPLLLTLGTAALAYALIRDREGPTLRDAGVGSFVVQLAAVAIGICLAAYDTNRSVEIRCRRDNDVLGVIALGLLLGVAVVGGIVITAALADARRRRRVHPWHVLLVPLAVALPYVLGFVLLIWAFSCLS